MARKKTSSAFEEIRAGLEEVLEYHRGNKTNVRVSTVAVDRVDVAALRQRLGLTQPQFACRFGFPLSTLRKWEQGLRCPSGASRTLLTVLDKEPHAVEKALGKLA